MPDVRRMRPGDPTWWLVREPVPLIPVAADLVARADRLVIVGTSLQVWPAAGLVHEQDRPRWWCSSTRGGKPSEAGHPAHQDKGQLRNANWPLSGSVD